MHFLARNTLKFKLNSNLKYGVRSELYLTLKIDREVREYPEVA